MNNDCQLASIKIKREAQLVSSGSKYSVFIDDEKVGTINADSEKLFEVQSGQHSVFVKVEVWLGKSSETQYLNLNPGEQVTLVCGMVGNIIWSTGRLYLRVEMVEEKSITSSLGQRYVVLVQRKMEF